MSDLVTDPETDDKTPSITSEDVAAYLRENPRFLQSHPEICDVLVPPKKTQGRKIADFQSFLIDRLKADKTKAETTTQEIVKTARNNMNNQARIARAVLRLLEAQSFDEFIEAVTMDLTAMLDVDITALIVESNGHDIPHVQSSGVRVVPAGTIQNWMQGKPSLLQSDIGGIEAIYGGGANLVRSQALVRVDISLDTPPAIIAFGSRDPELFQDGQGTEQVSFLARVVERLFRTWLNIPH
ncbi:MAG: hypothetical protein CMH28_10615 [Micavibrio sp.]|nr:hypothetical protein [Micavibrio sp.]